MPNTKLIEAVVVGDKIEVMRLLALRHDVNEKGCEQGWSALHFAAGKGHLVLIELLLQAGADVFATGIDNRTAYLISLAAGHIEACKILRDAEEKAGGDKELISSRSYERRLYCRAYEVSRLREFAGWVENGLTTALQNASGEQHEDDEGGGIVFLHQDFTVTRSVFRTEDVVFDNVDDAWKAFCLESLQFKAPHDFDLLPQKQVST